MIAIENVTKHYPRAARPALDNVSLSIEPGSIFGLLGPNGAGKTTLLSVLAGLLNIDAGRVLLEGRTPAQWKGGLSRILGFVPQELAFYPMLTVRENLRFYAGIQGLTGRLAGERIQSALAAVHLQDRVDARAENLSGGLKRRLNLAIGLLNAPKLLCLDEPTVGIDPHSRQYILDRIRGLREQGITVIYTSHYMEEMQRLCDAVAIIESGRVLVQDRLERLLQRYAHKRLRVRFGDGDHDGLYRRLQATLSHARWSPGSTVLDVDVDDPLAALETVRGHAADCGVPIASFEYARPSLEDVYLHLSGRPWDGDDAAPADLD